MRRISSPSFIALIFSAVCAVMLTACGGGGGGGGLPANLAIDVGAEGSILTINDTLTITYKGASASNFKNKASVTIGGTDITPLLVFNGKTASVKLYALQNLLNISGGAPNNTITAYMPDSQRAQEKFAFTNQPDLLLTTITNATGSTPTTPFCATATDDVKTCKVNNPNSDLPMLGDSLTVEGIARRASLLVPGIEQINGTGTANRLSSNSFNVTNLAFAEQATPTPNQADFAYKVNGVDKAFNLAIPGKVINNEFAVQLHNIASSHVISTWINDAVKSYLATVDATNPLKLVDADANNDALCDALARLRGNDNTVDGAAYCTLDITQIDSASVGINTTVDLTNCTGGSAPNCDGDFDSAWKAKVAIANAGALTGVAKITAFNASNAELGSESFALAVKKASSGGDGVSLVVRVNLGTDTAGNPLFALQIDSPTYKADQSGWDHSSDSFAANVYVSNFNYQGDCAKVDPTWNCNGTGLTNPTGAVNAQIGPMITNTLNVLAYRLARRYSINPSIDAAYLDKVLFCDGTTEKYPGGCDDLATADGANPWPWSTIGDVQYAPILNKAEDAIVSVAQQQLTALNFANPSNAGFISFTGSQKARDDGVYHAAIGTHFAEDASGSAVAQGNLNNTNDVSVALSSNWLNQMLLAAFQSDQLKLDETKTIDELGLSSFVSALSGIVDGTDPVHLTANFEQTPFIQYKNGMLEVVAYNVKVSAEILKPISANDPVMSSNGINFEVRHFIDTGTLNASNHIYFTMTADVKARFKLLANGRLLSLEPGDFMLAVSAADGVKIRLAYADSNFIENKIVLDNMIKQVQQALRDAGINYTVAEDGTILDPEAAPTNLQVLLHGFIQSQLEELLNQQAYVKTNIDIEVPGGSADLLKSLYENFFCTKEGSSLVKKTRELRLNADTAELDAVQNNNEAANLILAASLIDKTNSTPTDQPLMDLSINYAGCP